MYKKHKKNLFFDTNNIPKISTSCIKHIQTYMSISFDSWKCNYYLQLYSNFSKKTPPRIYKEWLYMYLLVHVIYKGNVHSIFSNCGWGICCAGKIPSCRLRILDPIMTAWSLNGILLIRTFSNSSSVRRQASSIWLNAFCIMSFSITMSLYCSLLSSLRQTSQEVSVKLRACTVPDTFASKGCIS